MAQEIHGGFAVEGMAQLMKTLRFAPKDVRLAVRKEFRTVAEPTRQMEERLAMSRIRRMKLSPQWAKFRTGVTQKLVYIAPRQKGSHGRGPTRRRNLGTLLAQRAAQPALKANEHRIEKDFSDMLDRLAHKWNSEGHKARL